MKSKNINNHRVWLLSLIIFWLFPVFSIYGQEKNFLYVATPGIRNYVEYGGVGIIVFDVDNGYKFVKRISTWDVPQGKEPENIKGIVANAKTGMLYLTTPQRVACLDLKTEKIVWEKTFEEGCDRLAISPDGLLLYVPSFEKSPWYVINALNGALIKKIETNAGAHNTIYGLDGKQVFLAGLRSPYLSVAETNMHTIAMKVGPFTKPVRPFTINGNQTRCYVNINDLLGFEIGDMKTGKMIGRVEVTGYETGKPKRHGCPSHGIALTHDEKEIWLCDGPNSMLHIFDVSGTKPIQKTSIKLRDQPGWISFSIDGRTAYPSTGEVIDVRTKKVIATLEDEAGRQVQSEKLLEIVFNDGKPIRVSDQFGLGHKVRLR